MKRILLVFLMLAMIPGALSARAEGAAFPERPCSRVYEPETSWSMSATVVWEADSSVFAAAEEEKRPATALVYPTPSLRIEDRNGRLISESIDEFVEKTSGTMIPAFYLRSRETASALRKWLEGSGLRDCFAVAAPGLKDAVREVADLPCVRGVIDFSGMTRADAAALAEMAACVNEARGKTVILSREAATRENVVRLQSLAATVWVRTASDTKSLLTMYTRGVHGVVVEDALKAVQTLEFFQDDAPTVLRIPLTIGHRGDPSSYVENTLDSAAGAVREGADAVENDIQLSADGKLFILHDEQMSRLFNRDVTAEKLTLAELKSIFADWDAIPGENEVGAEDSRYGTFYGQKEKKRYAVPTLEEYIRAFRDSGVIHDTEIKSANPAILPVYMALVDQYGAWDQFFSITFNPSILNAVYADYPRLSIGALGFLIRTDDIMMILFGDKSAFVPAEDTEAVLAALLSVLDSWNATANPSFENMPKDVLAAARHRGLTFWPWTYTEKQAFAEDYLFGMSGLTTDYPWWTANLLEEIEQQDLTAAAGEVLPAPMGRNKRNERVRLENAEAVRVEELSDGASLMIWRYRADLTLGGESFGSYYLYSEPFVLRMAAPAEVPKTGDRAEPFLWLAWMLLGALGLGAGGALRIRFSASGSGRKLKEENH